MRQAPEPRRHDRIAWQAAPGGGPAITATAASCPVADLGNPQAGQSVPRRIPDRQHVTAAIWDSWSDN